MTPQYAQEISAKYLSDAKTLCVTSDGAIYVDNDIEYMREHAKVNKLEIFVFKGEKELSKEIESVEKTEIVEEKKQSKKTK